MSGALVLKSLLGPRESCPAECSEWAFRLFRECVCSPSDALSLALGLASVFFWAVAEIPQIVSNFMAGSTEGVSLSFLLTWTIGDAFNLAGCFLEPATLPTQLYMAVMYTITTIILVSQTVYYEILAPEAHKPLRPLEVEEPLLEPSPTPAADIRTQVVVTDTMTVPLSRKTSSRDIYISSARSLAGSYTPSMGSFVPASHHGHHQRHVGSLLSQSPGQGAPHISLRSSFTPSPAMPMDAGFVLNGPPGARSAGAGPSTPSPSSAVRAISVGVCLLFLCFSPSAHTPQLSHPTLPGSLFRPGFGPGSSSGASAGAVLFAGPSRRLLSLPSPSLPRGIFQRRHSTLWVGAEAEDPSRVGELLGWLMAAIYMGGRLPQIWLNIQRGTVEGLSPLMFLFALLGNLTYVGSILVRSVAWEDIQPNLPWIVDAGVCVLLDMFILSQFVYYSYVTKEKDELEGLEDFQ